MKLHTSNGKTCLLVEKGGFVPPPGSKDDDEAGETDADQGDAGDSGETRPPGWHCGYEAYERA